jgi:Cu-processing system permease protein
MSAILYIARLTFHEAVRRRIALAMLVFGIAFLLIFSTGFHFIHQGAQSNSSAPEKIFEQGYNFMFLAAMYVVNFLVIATAALITSDTLAGEISSGAIQSLVSKPLRRYQIVLGKWLGNAILLALYLALMGAGIIVSVQVQSGYMAPHSLLGMGLIYLNGLLILTITLAFSSTYSTLATGGAIFGLYGLSFIGGWVERIGAFVNNQTAIDLGIASSLLIPTEAIWNLASSQMTTSFLRSFGQNPFTSGSVPSPLMVIYTILYLLGFMALAIRNFAQRDL